MDTFKLEYNIKLRSVLEMLLNHSHVKQVQMKPYVLQYIHRNADKNESPGIGLEESNITISHLSDTSDTSDMVLETSAKNESEKNIPLQSQLQKKIFGTFAESSKRVSDTSDTSDSCSNVVEESSGGNGEGHGQNQKVSFSFVTHPNPNNKVSEHVTKLGKYGTWKCNHCEYKDNVVGIITHLRRGHNIRVVE